MHQAVFIVLDTLEKRERERERWIEKGSGKERRGYLVERGEGVQWREVRVFGGER